MKNEDQLSEKELTTALRRRAMDYLARREHSRYELQCKLREKFEIPGDALISSVLDRLEADNLLSNTRFAESYVRSRIGRGYGPLYIRYQLRQRQVDSVLIDQVLTFDEDEWADVLADALAKKVADMPERGSKQWLKLQRFSQSRGFSLSHFNAACQEKSAATAKSQ
ncbi:regulatory protein RecX [Pseudohongiella sp.]|uniref:Regulatory protein RecX n=1 Tax=marine sediment metagenome TaxID=412755 RepID=A0A0F9YI57_9ZZZZ|nr:regulatory protein RecX [Pseudohongiella sp.]HDZ08529.1 regulatory protein RecX [Pseudohongiella sp.]HEA61733.1 regulatory protein RecX [Pseudohongiella sp.]